MVTQVMQVLSNLFILHSGGIKKVWSLERLIFRFQAYYTLSSR